MLQQRVRYLGHIVSQEGVVTDPAKIEAISNWLPHREIRELQAFLGMTGYYCQYIPDYASTAKPLTRLIGKDTPWVWDEKTQEVFSQLKDNLINAPVLGYPDARKAYILDTEMQVLLE